MSERRLRELLLEAPLPREQEAERRAMLLVAAAFAARPRTGPARRSAPARLALALIAVLLLGALLLSPAGAAVRHWVGDVFASAKTPAPAPALGEVPGGGRLLIGSADGPWVVSPNGSRRLLGRYDEATWSPHGLFIGAAESDSLSAIEPDGTPRWSLSSAGPVRDPRWSPSGFRIAFRSAATLRVVGADGAGESLLAPRVAPVAPVWSPRGAHQLAFLDAAGRLQLLDTDSRRSLASAPALAATATLGWAPPGSPILEASPRALRTRSVAKASPAGRLSLGRAHLLSLPPAATVGAAAFSPRGTEIAAILNLPARAGRPAHGEVVLINPPNGSPRRLLNVPGSLSDLLWSPDASRLLVAWPNADQWLFIPLRGGRQGRAFGPISPEFAPGARPGAEVFPRLEGWCCAQDASR